MAQRRQDLRFSKAIPRTSKGGESWARLRKAQITLAGSMLILGLTTTGASAQESYTIRPLRWEEDYAAFAPGPDASLAERLKHIDLSDSAANYVSVGGELRLRTEAYDEPLFGINGVDDYTSNQTRALLHADLHIGPRFRTFVQLGAFDEQGREPRQAAFDESALDVVQAFADWRFGDNNRWRLRLGRQEISAGRLVSIREGATLRRTFDGVRLSGPLAGGEWDSFAATLTQQRDTDAFDDQADNGDRMWGALFTRHLSANMTGTLTYVGRRNERARFASASGIENTHLGAIRLTYKQGPLDVEAQGSLQSGSLGALDVRAWAFASEAGYTFRDAQWKPRLAVRLDAASGDEDPNDNVQGTLDLPYPSLNYLSDAVAIAPRNLADVHPFVSITPSPALRVDVGSEFIWRLEPGDALYAPPSIVLAPPGVPGSYVGAQIYGRVTWKPSRHVEVITSIVRIEPGEVLENAGGEPQTFGAASLSWRF